MRTQLNGVYKLVDFRTGKSLSRGDVLTKDGKRYSLLHSTERGSVHVIGDDCITRSFDPIAFGAHWIFVEGVAK